MNPEASNALLKTLEEPPKGTHLVLTATTECALLPTVVSRCQVLRCSLLPLETLEFEISRDTGLPGDSSHFLAHLSEGSRERAHQLFDGDILGLRERLLAYAQMGLEAVPSLLTLSHDMARDRDSLLASLHILRTLVRDLLLLSHKAEKIRMPDRDQPSEYLINADRTETLRALASKYSNEAVAAYAQWLEDVEVLVERNVNRELIAASSLVFWVQEAQG
jgi:DNA polymerase-3 subunit delta'